MLLNVVYVKKRNNKTNRVVNLFREISERNDKSRVEQK